MSKKKEEKFIQNFIKAIDEIMLDLNFTQDVMWKMIFVAWIYLSKGVK